MFCFVLLSPSWRQRPQTELYLHFVTELDLYIATANMKMVTFWP